MPCAGDSSSSARVILIENGFKGNLKRLGLPDSYVQHGSRSQILSHLLLDDSGIKTKVLELIDEVKEFH